MSNMNSNVIRPNINGVFPILRDGLHNVAMGNGTQYEVCITRTERGIVFGIIGKGCYTFGFGGHHCEYIIDKMGINPHYTSCARNTTDRIPSQFTQDFTPIGEYQLNLCAK